MHILGIETSCDETGVAIYDSKANCLLADVLHSQIALHAQFGGVVPELASRDHIRKTVPLIYEALAHANLTVHDIDAVAYTAGPGLAGALLVGASIGQSLGFALNVPTIAVHHMEAHLFAIFLREQSSTCNVSKDGDDAQPLPRFPFLALLVSGGHTQLVLVEELGKYHLLGETLDDAAGEAFDKVAKILGLPYPGGAALSKLAQHGNSERFHFPRPMVQRSGLEFSFSGLKTFALNTLRAVEREEGRVDICAQSRADIARAFEDALVDTLVIKCRRALQQTQLKQLVLAGGVSANRALRVGLQRMVDKLGGITLHCPQPKFCTDNGAMVAYAGYQYLQRGWQNTTTAINIFPRWPLERERLQNQEQK